LAREFQTVLNRVRDCSAATPQQDPPLRMFLLRGVEDRTGKLRIERAGQHAFENARGALSACAARSVVDAGGKAFTP